MPYDIFNNPDRRSAYYSIQSDDFRMRHTAIWTEVQHYTWVLSVILGVGPIAAINQSTLNSMQLWFLLSLPIFGAVIAVIAFLISIRRVFCLLYASGFTSIVHRERIAAAIRNDYVDERLRRAWIRFQCLPRCQAASCNWRSVFRLRIRALILSTFVLYAIAGLSEACYFAFLLLRL